MKNFIFIIVLLFSTLDAKLSQEELLAKVKSTKKAQRQSLSAKIKRFKNSKSLRSRPSYIKSSKHANSYKKREKSKVQKSRGSKKR